MERRCVLSLYALRSSLSSPETKHRVVMFSRRLGRHFVRYSEQLGIFHHSSLCVTASVARVFICQAGGGNLVHDGGTLRHTVISRISRILRCALGVHLADMITAIFSLEKLVVVLHPPLPLLPDRIEVRVFLNKLGYTLYP